MQEKDLEVVIDNVFKDYGDKDHTIDLYNVLGDLKYMLEKNKPGLLLNYKAIISRKMKEKFDPK